jgi:hypothetical protein
MKICLIGPGLMEIPPIGWGAIEIIIWDYYQLLTKKGHEVIIINDNDKKNIIKIVNNHNPDFVHLHYDDYIDILNAINCNKKAITSHYGYFKENFKKYDKFYKKIISGIIYNNCYIFCLSKEILNIYKIYGVDISRLILLSNGARDDLFLYRSNPEYNQSIYLAKITPRKKQYLFQCIENLFFVGNKEDKNFDYQNNNYLGEWDKSDLYFKLSNYVNLVLLSDGEADPLVVKEALICGLGLVLTKTASANLDLNHPFINIIDDDKVTDLNYISEVINNNRAYSISNRNNIRQYGLNNFSYTIIIDRYIKIIENLPYRNNNINFSNCLKILLKWRI